MTRNTFRTKSYTKSTNTSISHIEKLRKTQLARVSKSDYKRIKFLKSSAFDAQVKRNIKMNRYYKSSELLKKVANRIADSDDRIKVVKSIFGQKYSKGVNGVKYKRNSFTSTSGLNRLKRIYKQVETGKFHIKRYVANTEKYKELKKFLPDNASVGEILTIMNRTVFYWENKKLIDKHNTNVRRHGTANARLMTAAQKLKRVYTGKKGEEELTFYNKVFPKK